MFIDDKRAVTLEYIFYQEGSKYSKLVKKENSKNMLGKICYNESEVQNY